VSDLHLGNLLGRGWLARLATQITTLRPDLVVLVGDIIEGHERQMEPLLPVLRQIRAPLGVWAVTGNHEFYAGYEQSVSLLEQAGYGVLCDKAVALAPGLVLAGVDDLTARRQFNRNGEAITRALAGRPPGATILLSHTPWQAEVAARAGAGLMLSGHTHNGQIWPFNYLVRLSYRLLGGRYQVGDMTLLVGRGTGTWGPRMRLWQRSEILRITVRAPTP
jgi:predicted MPP superfamily phosphohydrolase